jgi:hypothetical protein
MLLTVLGIVGLALVLVATIDAVWTTLSLDGAGPVAGLVSGSVWRLLLAMNDARGRILSFGATFILMAILGVWLGMLLAGWTLIFGAVPGAVAHFDTGEAAGVIERLYFAGFTLTTLGMGDFVPVGAWRIGVVLCAVNGLLVITLSISYFVPVLDAGMAGRRLATYIAGLGLRPQDIVLRAWYGYDGEPGSDDWDHHQLDTYLIELTEMINSHTHRHVAYPVVHYFHSSNPDQSTALRIVAVDEAVTLFEHAVAPEVRPHPLVLHGLRAALTGYLTVQGDIFVQPAENVPPPPSLEPLRRRGVPLCEEAQYHEAVETMADRRRLLLNLVRHDGWRWTDVEGETRGHAV